MKGRQRSQPGIITAMVMTGTRYAQKTAACHLSHRSTFTLSHRFSMGRRLTQWLETAIIGLEKSTKTFQVKRLNGLDSLQMSTSREDSSTVWRRCSATHMTKIITKAPESSSLQVGISTMEPSIPSRIIDMT